MRSLLIPLLLTILFLIVGVAYLRCSTLLVYPSTKLRIDVPQGIGINGLSRLLKNNGIHIHPTELKLYFKLSGRWNELQSGIHVFNGPLTRLEFIQALLIVPIPDERSVTLKEGWTRWEIADALSEAQIVTRDSFLTEVEKRKAEGCLFPNTYRFYPHMSPVNIVTQLMKECHVKIDQILTEYPSTNSKITEDNYRYLLTLASLVERESAVAHEQPLIAKVLINRLAKGMKLQSDPSCIYSASLYKSRAHPSNCKDPTNQYSTYIIKGLPPGPIGNPGVGAIRAALMPDQRPITDSLLYFVAKQDGSREHYFSPDYKTHKWAVKYYLHGKGSPPPLLDLHIADK